MSRAERVKQIVLLLEHRLDYLDGAIRVAQSFPSKPGAQPTHRVACGCGHLVLRTPKGRETPVWTWERASDCLLCGPDGFRNRMVIDGDAQQDERGAIFDSYTYAHDRSTKAGQEGTLRVMTREETDRELAQLRSNVRARAGMRPDAYGWERARERRDRSGSFRELDAALDALGIRSPALAALVANVFKGVYGEGRIPKGASTAYKEALLFIEARMPDPIRVPQYLQDAENGKDRREKVTDTYKRTNSISKTAFSHGMGKARVRVILRDAGLLG